MASPARNVEIKAKIEDLETVLEKCRQLSNSEGEILRQEDYFFNVPKGRLKLRFILGESTELIFYERPNVEGPKLCTYSKCVVDDGNCMLTVLRSTLGIKGLVKKVRTLFLIGQTRIHVDHVNELGNFLEMEVVLDEDESPEEGESIAINLMKQLGVHPHDLLRDAYIDMLLE